MVCIGFTCGLSQQNVGGQTLYQDYTLRCFYQQAAQAAGATSLFLPAQPQADYQALLQAVDALVLTGGGDLHSSFWGEQPRSTSGFVDLIRDRFELALAKLALAGDLPVLGICRGMQVLNVALGGSLYQDLAERHHDGPVLNHQQLAPASQTWHSLQVCDKPGQALFQQESFAVNSFHHQGVKELGQGLQAAALAPDGLVEALTAADRHFAWGVQWHPERLYQTHLPSTRLFAAFAAAAGA